MGAWIGTLGRLMKLDGVSAQQVEHWDGTSFKRTLEGKMVAQVKAKRGREWKLSIGVGTPATLAAIQALQSGEWGNGPFVFVPPLAPVTNMLAPEVSTCGPLAVISTSVSVVGPLSLPDGSVAGRSLFNSTPASAMYFGPATVPVLPNTKVTASAYLAGAGCKVAVNFYTAAGAYISGASSSASGVAGVATRLSVTATTPATAASCAIYGSNTTNGARPALTWTDELFDWGIGAGCDKAVPYGFSTSLILALKEKNYGRYSSLGFNVQEVG